MKWITRPWIMAAASAALVVGAAALILRSSPGQSRPTPSAVAAGDREIVWLYTTTTASSWERFVAAVQRAGRRLQIDHPGVQALVGDAAFPKQTTAVPEVALALPAGAGRLVFRWYKITTDWKTRDWVQALVKRRPPPLAIIGGSSSDAGRELAWQLRRQCAELPEQDRPLLLLTTATADRVTDPDAPPDAPAEARETDLTRVYPDRTFRYCFSNKQMATAVMSFLRTQEGLRPDANAVHMVQWDDDSYSHDLTDGFEEVLRNARTTGGDDGADDSGTAPSGTVLTNPERIASSVGSFLTPNRFEAEAVEHVVQDLELNPGDRPLTDDRRGLTEALRDVEGKRAGTRRPLLVVTGQSAPSRRFLRELACTTPAQARRLVVATGDAVAFNTVYRDRRVTWPIQDLPFAFVFFCHFDPIHNNTGDPDLAFLPEGAPPPDGEKDFNLSSTGTEDVLLNGAIIESLVQAFDRDGKPAADAGELSRRLADIRHRRGLFGYDSAGTPLFGPDGNRRAGAGENIVYLRPHFDGDRVLPEATIEVWVSRETIVGALHPWELHAEPLAVSYEPPVVEEGAGP